MEIRGGGRGREGRVLGKRVMEKIPGRKGGGGGVGKKSHGKNKIPGRRGGGALWEKESHEKKKKGGGGGGGMGAMGKEVKDKKGWGGGGYRVKERRKGVGETADLDCPTALFFS